MSCRCCVCGRMFKKKQYDRRKDIPFEDSNEMCTACVDAISDALYDEEEEQYEQEERYAIQHEMEAEE